MSYRREIHGARSLIEEGLIVYKEDVSQAKASNMIPDPFSRSLKSSNSLI